MCDGWRRREGERERKTSTFILLNDALFSGGLAMEIMFHVFSNTKPSCYMLLIQLTFNSLEVAVVNPLCVYACKSPLNYVTGKCGEIIFSI